MTTGYHVFGGYPKTKQRERKAAKTTRGSSRFEKLERIHQMKWRIWKNIKRKYNKNIKSKNRKKIRSNASKRVVCAFYWRNGQIKPLAHRYALNNTQGTKKTSDREKEENWAGQNEKNEKNSIATRWCCTNTHIHTDIITYNLYVCVIQFNRKISYIEILFFECFFPDWQRAERRHTHCVMR